MEKNMQETYLDGKTIFFLQIFLKTNPLSE